MVIFLIAAIALLILWLLEKKKHEQTQNEVGSLTDQLHSVAAERDLLISKYGKVIDADAEAEKILVSAQDILNHAKIESEDAIAEAKSTAGAIISNAKEEAKKIRANAQRTEEKAIEASHLAQRNAEKIIADAKAEAKEIAGNAIEAQGKAKEYEKTAMAMKRLIEGYGDEWLKPAYSLLDELADEFGYTEAGQKLKEARALSARMVKDGIAANCSYVEDYRRVTAIQFVTDAFNGKVDSILSKVKHDNYGVLEQKIKDAFQLVNKNGAAFRNAHILPAYLDARLDELKWATIAQELRKKAAEEQRELREKIREEEKARKEYERAQKEAAKEEAMLQKALEKAKAMLASAGEAQRAQYEAQLSDLEEKLRAAEEKNQRALSMAQQTKRGTVYIISNVGSFGENVYKVGMTRRLDPLDRVRELGDASVPFPFDVHAFIESDDAPALETALHHELALAQMNKVNPRKEFFRADISIIKKLVDSKGLEANWTMAAQAAEYRESIAIEERIKKDPAERSRWEKFISEAPTLDVIDSEE